MLKLTKPVAWLVSVALSFLGGNAAAQIGGAAPALVVASPALSLGGLGVTLATAVVTGPHRPSLALRISGYVLAGLNLAVGAATIAFGAAVRGDSDLDKVSGLFMALGSAQVLIGGAGLGVTVWASKKPARDEARVELAPWVGQDAGRHVAFGLAVRVLRF